MTQQKRATNMKISTDLPPNIRAITDALGAQPNAIFCYGDTIYNPNGRVVSPDIEIHEEVHMKQQGNDPDLWYYKYLNDSDFRLSQEIEAYGTQLAFVKKCGVKGSMFAWAKDSMAKALSGDGYGKLLSYREAEQAIRQFANKLK